MHRLWISVSIVLISVGFAATAHAQADGEITGTVTDAGSNGPIPGVNVQLVGTSIGGATGAEGTYRITGVEPGRYTLAFSFVGYTARTVPVEVKAGETTTVDIAMEEGVFEGDEVVISGSQSPEKLTDTPATIELITAADIQFLPTYSAGELLARQKGVDYFRAGIATTAINVRGFNSNFNAKNLQVTDNRYSTLIATGLPFGPMDPTISEDIAQQEIVLGPNGALYGPNAHNGLVNTITKDPRNSEGTVVNLKGGNQSTLGGSVRHAQVVNDQLAFKANLGYNRAEEFAFADSVYIDRNGDGVTEGYPEYKLDRDVEFLKGSAALYYTPGGGNSDIIFNYAGSNNTYLSPTNVGRNQIKDWRLHVFQGRFVSPKFFAQAYYTVSRTDDTYAIDDRTKGYYTAIDAGFSEEEAEERSLSQTGARFIDDSERFNAEAQYRDVFSDFEVTAGVQWQRDMANSRGSYLLDGGKDESITLDQVGGYGQIARDLPAGFRALFAFRADHHEIYGFNFLPKAALLKKVGPNSTFRLTYGRGIAAPTILNQFGDLFGGLILGNAEGFTLEDGTVIEPQTVEELQTFEAGFKGLVGGKLFADVNAYYNISENFLSPVTVIGAAGANPVVKRGETPIDQVQTAPLGGTVATYVNFGRFDTYGTDFGLTYQFSDALSATFNYSYFDITFDESNLEENDFNNDGVVNKLDHKVNSPNHKGSLAINYNGDRFFGSTFFRAVEAYDYFSSFQVAAETQDLVYRGTPVVEDAPGTDSYNYGPLAGFVTVDVGAGYKVNDHLRFSVQVTNLFNTEYREFTASPFVGRLFSANMRVAF